MKKRDIEQLGLTGFPPIQKTTLELHLLDS